MKSKYTTYILIIAVLAVWGIIVKKLFFGKPAEPAGSTVNITAVPKTEEKPLLSLDYPDPFVPRPKKQPAGKGLQAANQKKPEPADIRKILDLRFVGTVRNGNRVNYIVTHRGEYVTLSIGGEFGGIRLVKAMPDSLVFSMGQTIYYLKTAE